MTLWDPSELAEETLALQKFKAENPQFFKKNDAALALHLAAVISLLALSTGFTLASPWLLGKLFFGAISGFLWFCLINTTIHHHQTHRNAAQGPLMKKVLDVIFLIALPNAPKRKIRYIRAHMNHHLRPFHETDVDHHYGTRQYFAMMKNFWTAFLYFAELTFVGAYMPGWEDERYMNEIPLERWNRRDYEAVKKLERKVAVREALLQWGAFLGALGIARLWPVSRGVLQTAMWGWAFPMLLVKNWAHFLGQFQHYHPEFPDEKISINRKTKSFHVPGWLNYLAAGELSGHFLHHLYPEMPYYYVEKARRKFSQNPELSRQFLIY